MVGVTEKKHHLNGLQNWSLEKRYSPQKEKKKKRLLSSIWHLVLPASVPDSGICSKDCKTDPVFALNIEKK